MHILQFIKCRSLYYLIYALLFMCTYMYIKKLTVFAFTYLVFTISAAKKHMSNWSILQCCHVVVVFNMNCSLFLLKYSKRIQRVYLWQTVFIKCQLNSSGDKKFSWDGMAYDEHFMNTHSWCCTFNNFCIILFSSKFMRNKKMFSWKHSDCVEFVWIWHVKFIGLISLECIPIIYILKRINNRTRYLKQKFIIIICSYYLIFCCKKI